MKIQKFNRYKQNTPLCKFCIERGGSIYPIDPSGINKKTNPGFMNPAIMVYNNNLIGILRTTNYILNVAEQHKYTHSYGPLLYVHRENDVTLRTWNYFLEFNEDYSIKSCIEIDTSYFDKPPKWTMIGLEDARLVHWDNKLFVTGVRRDTTDTGVGRMQLSELQVNNSTVKEVSRVRIPAPGADNTYCEKNWMPFEDKPYTFLKWSSPTEVVEFNNEKTKVVSNSGKNHYTGKKDLRGGSQLIKWGKGHLAITHTVDLTKNYLMRKNGIYLHQFAYYEDSTLKKVTKDFSFLAGRTEFCVGMCKFKEKVIITFSYHDNLAFLLETSEETITEFMRENGHST